MHLTFITAVLCCLYLHHHATDATASSVVPGYLDFDNLPETNFSCQKKVIGGYYADIETGCQMFHVCTIGQKGEVTDIKFLCLNGTVFDQATRVCERVDEVDCSKAEEFFDLNLELYGNNAFSFHNEDDDSPAKDDPTTPPPPTTTTPAPTTTSTTTTPRPPSSVLPTLQYLSITTHRPSYASQKFPRPNQGGGYSTPRPPSYLPATPDTDVYDSQKVARPQNHGGGYSPQVPRPQHNTGLYASTEHSTPRGQGYHSGPSTQSPASYPTAYHPKVTTQKSSQLPQNHYTGAGVTTLLAIHNAYNNGNRNQEANLEDQFDDLDEYTTSGDGAEEFEEDEEEEPIVIHKPISHRYPVTTIRKGGINVESNGEVNHPVNGHSSFTESLAKVSASPQQQQGYQYNRGTRYGAGYDSVQENSNVHAQHKVTTDFILNRQRETDRHQVHGGYNNQGHQNHFSYSTTTQNPFFQQPSPVGYSSTAQPFQTQSLLKRKLQEEILHPQNPNYKSSNPLFTTPSIAIVSQTSSTSFVSSVSKVAHPAVPNNGTILGISSIASVNGFALPEVRQHNPHNLTLDFEYLQKYVQTTPPVTYDEYVESDVQKDPFYKDVRRITTKLPSLLRQRRDLRRREAEIADGVARLGARRSVDGLDGPEDRRVHGRGDGKPEAGGDIALQRPVLRGGISLEAFGPVERRGRQKVAAREGRPRNVVVPSVPYATRSPIVITREAEVKTEPSLQDPTPVYIPVVPVTRRTVHRTAVSENARGSSPSRERQPENLGRDTIPERLGSEPRTIGARRRTKNLELARERGVSPVVGEPVVEPPRSSYRNTEGQRVIPLRPRSQSVRPLANELPETEVAMTEARILNPASTKTIDFPPPSPQIPLETLFRLDNRTSLMYHNEAGEASATDLQNLTPQIRDQANSLLENHALVAMSDDDVVVPLFNPHAQRPLEVEVTSENPPQVEALPQSVPTEEVSTEEASTLASPIPRRNSVRGRGTTRVDNRQQSISEQSPPATESRRTNSRRGNSLRTNQPSRVPDVSEQFAVVQRGVGTDNKEGRAGSRGSVRNELSRESSRTSPRSEKRPLSTGTRTAPNVDTPARGRAHPRLSPSNDQPTLDVNVPVVPRTRSRTRDNSRSSTPATPEPTPIHERPEIKPRSQPSSIAPSFDFQILPGSQEGPSEAPVTVAHVRQSRPRSRGNPPLEAEPQTGNRVSQPRTRSRTLVGTGDQTESQEFQRLGGQHRTRGRVPPNEVEQPRTRSRVPPTLDEPQRIRGRLPPNLVDQPLVSLADTPRAGEHIRPRSRQFPSPDDQPQTSLADTPRLGEQIRTRSRESPRLDDRPRTRSRLPARADDQSTASQVTAETVAEPPVLTTRPPLPETSFSCADKVPGGYYADLEADCQLFHICSQGRHGRIKDNKFLCGPGTRFNQQSLTCQTRDLVNCGLSASLYHLNNHFTIPLEEVGLPPEDGFEAHKVLREKRDTAQEFKMAAVMRRRRRAVEAEDDNYEYYDEEPEEEVATSPPVKQASPAPAVSPPIKQVSSIPKISPPVKQETPLPEVTLPVKQVSSLPKAPPQQETSLPKISPPVKQETPLPEATLPVKQVLSAPPKQEPSLHISPPVKQETHLLEVSPPVKQESPLPAGDDEYYDYGDDEVIDNIASSSNTTNTGVSTLKPHVVSTTPISETTQSATEHVDDFTTFNPLTTSAKATTESVSTTKHIGTTTKSPKAAPFTTVGPLKTVATTDSSKTSTPLGEDYFNSNDYVNDNYEPSTYTEKPSKAVVKSPPAKTEPAHLTPGLFNSTQYDDYYDDDDELPAGFNDVAPTQQPRPVATTQILGKLRDVVVEMLENDELWDDEEAVSNTVSPTLDTGATTGRDDLTTVGEDMLTVTEATTTYLDEILDSTTDAVAVNKDLGELMAVTSEDQALDSKTGVLSEDRILGSTPESKTEKVPVSKPDLMDEENVEHDSELEMTTVENATLGTDELVLGPDADLEDIDVRSLGSKPNVKTEKKSSKPDSVLLEGEVTGSKDNDLKIEEEVLGSKPELTTIATEEQDPTVQTSPLTEDLTTEAETATPTTTTTTSTTTPPPRRGYKGNRKRVRGTTAEAPQSSTSATTIQGLFDRAKSRKALQSRHSTPLPPSVNIRYRGTVTRKPPPRKQYPRPDAAEVGSTSTTTEGRVLTTDVESKPDVEQVQTVTTTDSILSTEPHSTPAVGERRVDINAGDDDVESGTQTVTTQLPERTTRNAILASSESTIEREDSISRDKKPFDCRGRELHRYYPDRGDRKLFHYCSTGFHARQVLDFRFVCDLGTEFNAELQKCE